MCGRDSTRAEEQECGACRLQRKMEFRIGINVGDVIVEGERLYGDGVNIAARLEGLAEPGGICISGTVYDQVKNKLALGYEYLGEQAGQEHCRAGAGVAGTMGGGGKSTGRGSTSQKAEESAKGKSRSQSSVSRRLNRCAALIAGQWWLWLELLLIACNGHHRPLSLLSSAPSTQHSAPRTRSRRCRCPTNPPSSSCRSST